MSYGHKPSGLPSNLRQPSMGGGSHSTSQSPILLARINEKRAELENLKQLRDLSAGLATQMQALHEKLTTLNDGTEVAMPKPKPSDGTEQEQEKEKVPLPKTLVRIPTDQPQLLQPQPSSGGGTEHNQA
ncbi:MAG: hypothetical protein M1834_001911 [Cirrosporium novae-zelandiae]|nr:MAG: hypothetical protein M1834_001911 [Cirrosporium novae-zelandiae]